MREEAVGEVGTGRYRSVRVKREGLRHSYEKYVAYTTRWTPF